ncbi:MAG: TolC family outer membrane protein [Gammaproteobacteria bacterium]|uniref:TolC family outer membrane protein n=1 Tax=Rhodoferax sp. TaxID=50421 RepID=UPI0017AA0407|nr:TolC family outer membrane protein [Rhodoferax sp.]MBU3897627.1 TolC family outer membrane protein [Gammaproteobacteria bacterium]MBA3058253.1 TolC family outer membrane protein [Rhodoferax sp.]MBU3999468.1 TolC family outer membrane protein [Gammaproteobacteria bacterium]MBU4017729.1 TolC family outer membrane protein [Gammaproteobacteria bacterium]MBU4081172.1 TolC family outer membrane protein [Gammaproteobacteria bacterium]
MKTFRLLPLFVAIGATLALPVQAQSLVDLYQSARDYDATYQSAKSQFVATLARADQAKALLLPTVGLSLGASATNLDSTLPPSQQPTSNYNSQSATVSASQPLYRPANRASYEQGMKQVDLAQAQLAAADQDLIVRVSQAYFDVLAAMDNLTFVKAQKAAVGEQLASAKRNFEVGTATITDTREAQARFDLGTAQEIAAENDLRVKKIALEQLVGKAGAQPSPLAQPLALPTLVPSDVNAWVAQAESNHPGIKQSQVALDVAQLETQKAQAGHKPTLDLTAGYNITQNNGTANTSMDYRTNAATIGLAFNLPLFAGFAIQNRVRETLALEDKARNDLEATRRAVAQGTRTAFFGVESGQGQVKALEAAEASSQSALDANKLGYDVGVRINIDVLNSQSQLYDTKAKLAKARYDVLLGELRLRQASGTLQAQDLQGVNALLAK